MEEKHCRNWSRDNYPNQTKYKTHHYHWYCNYCSLPLDHSIGSMKDTNKFDRAIKGRRAIAMHAGCCWRHHSGHCHSSTIVALEDDGFMRSPSSDSPVKTTYSNTSTSVCVCHTYSPINCIHYKTPTYCKLSNDPDQAETARVNERVDWAAQGMTALLPTTMSMGMGHELMSHESWLMGS